MVLYPLSLQRDPWPPCWLVICETIIIAFVTPLFTSSFNLFLGQKPSQGETVLACLLAVLCPPSVDKWEQGILFTWIEINARHLVFGGSPSLTASAIALLEILLRRISKLPRRHPPACRTPRWRRACCSCQHEPSLVGAPLGLTKRFASSQA